MLPTSDAATSSAVHRSLWLTILGISVAAGIMVLGGMAILGSRDDAWEQAKQHAGNLLLTLDRDITRNISVLDLSLKGLMEAMAEPGIDQVSPSIRQHALFDRSASAEDLGAILALDATGDIVASSIPVERRWLDLADRDYFKVHQQNADVGLFVSRPFRGRLSDEWQFAISRRVGGPDNMFAGVVSASVRLTYLHRLVEKLSIGSSGTIALLRDDGRVLFRWPFHSQDVDLDLSQGDSTWLRLKAVRSGQYIADGEGDGVERLYMFRRLGDLPLILTVSQSTDEILERWRRKTAVLVPVLMLLSGSSVLSALLFRREMIRRTRMECILGEAAEQLRRQASTDGLTGLLNRHAFDVELDRAFTSAVRRKKSLAVLMLDADHFKRFNDMYGHIAGDDVLRAIAACMQAPLRRPYDVAARYGGEEFVAILPDTDVAGAMRIAASIQDAVRQLGIRHGGSPLGTVTVSIGVAAAIPLVGDTVADLVRCADQGLYAAKQAGRDTVRCGFESEHFGFGLHHPTATAGHTLPAS